ncbi:MAG: hypothetical protein H6737_04365 [Alphaproteobacteria bacterium]|nr:hypothetical protein [Alphaproteobacteria bacterium]
MPARLPLFLAVLAGCAPDSDYTLAIDPITPPNVTMGFANPDVTLVHRVGARQTLYPLGSLADGDFGGLPPLEDGVVGLLVTREGTASDTYDPDTLLGYGESPLDGPLATGREERHVPILVSELGGTGELGSVPRRRAPLLGAAALLPSGEAWMFGGLDASDTTPHGVIQRVADLRSGIWDAVEVGQMPGASGNAASVLHTATVLDDGTILVTGGRPAYFAIANNTSNAFIWDPVTGEVAWQASNGMNPARSRHQAVKLLDGGVLVFGGWQGAGVDAEEGTFQIFDPGLRRFVGFGTAGAGPLGTNVAAIGGDGAVACGGFRFDFTAEKLVGTAVCDRITLSGDVIPFPDLPEAVSMGAIAALPDGRVLLAGGIVGDVDIPFADGFLVGANVADATDRAWLYEPEADAWRELPRLSDPRAGGVAVPTGDGRFVILGGAAKAGSMISEDEGPVYCPEVFDPSTETFRNRGSCATPGSGVLPLVSVQPGLGAFVVEGHVAAGGTESGGQAYGIIGLAPSL